MAVAKSSMRTSGDGEGSRKESGLETVQALAMTVSGPFFPSDTRCKEHQDQVGRHGQSTLALI